MQHFFCSGITGKIKRIYVKFLKRKVGKNEQYKMSQKTDLTFMIQTCLPCLRFAKMIWCAEETHDPNKQVNTSPTQQAFSASPLLFLLLPSTILFLHTRAHTHTHTHAYTHSNQPPCSSFPKEVNQLTDLFIICLSLNLNSTFVLSSLTLQPCMSSVCIVESTHLNSCIAVLLMCFLK